VSDGWIGSRGATSKHLNDLIEESLESGRSVTLARTSEVPEEEESDDGGDLDSLLPGGRPNDGSGEVVDFFDLIDDA
jgi:hypothetical protein